MSIALTRSEHLFSIKKISIATGSPRFYLPCRHPPSAAAATTGMIRKLADGDAEFSVTAAGEEFEVEFTEESEVIAADDTTVTVEEGSISTIQIGSDTYSVVYDENDEVESVTKVSGSTTSRRTQQNDLADRRLQSCEEQCTVDAGKLCGALELGCGIPLLAALLPPVICDNVDALCGSAAGIVAGCDRQCAPGERVCRQPKSRRPLITSCTRSVYEPAVTLAELS